MNKKTYEKVLDREYIPTAEEFNHLMDECIEYKKLDKLQNHLKWFKGKVAGVDINKLNNAIEKRINEIPEVSRIFDVLPHGQTTKTGNERK
tara:strand:+ start:2382 stop:2654 length:273 start_codon:yes stop_codon:yes gene_type:complete